MSEPSTGNGREKKANIQKPAKLTANKVDEQGGKQKGILEISGSGVYSSNEGED